MNQHVDALMIQNIYEKGLYKKRKSRVMEKISGGSNRGFDWSFENERPGHKEKEKNSHINPA